MEGIRGLGPITGVSAEDIVKNLDEYITDTEDGLVVSISGTERKTNKQNKVQDPIHTSYTFKECIHMYTVPSNDADSCSKIRGVRNL